MNSTFPRALRASFSISLFAALLAGCNSASTRPLKLVENVSQPDRPVDSAVHASRDEMRADLYFLTSDRLEGRGIDTQGIDIAADFIAARFQSLGLKPLPGLDGYFQPFEITTADSISPDTTLAINNEKLKLKSQFTAASFSAEKSFDGPVVFAGYSITSKDHDYDDFANLDVKGKVVLALRFEPHDPKTGKSRWGGDDWSVSAHLETKARAAADHGATALILVNPPKHHDDALLPFSRQFVGNVTIPVLHVKQEVADEMLKKGGLPTLAKLQEKIDASAKPDSAPLKDVIASGKVAIKRTTRTLKNVVGMIPGTGPHADEYVIVGAHYDHLGWGGPGSLMNMPLLMRQPGVTEPAKNGHPNTQPSTRPSTQPSGHENPHAIATRPTTTPTIPLPTTRAIHHGADDNGSGTTSVLELARIYSHRSAPARTLVFICFTGEETGLKGSAYFVNKPPIDLKKVAAMLNLDMVGRLRKNLLYVGGAGTAAPFDAILKKAKGDTPLEFKSFGRGGLGPSDHMSFALKKVPVLFFFTGTHEDYHRPTDTAEKINYDGMEKVVELCTDVIDQLEKMPMSKYDSTADGSGMMNPAMVPDKGARRATLGIVPDYSSGEEGDGKGVKIAGTVQGSPANKIGLQEGDVILELGNKPTGTLQELSTVLVTLKPGEKVKLVYRRGDKTITTEVTLGLRGGG